MKSHTKRMLRACLSLLLALIIAVSPISITASAAQYSTCAEAKATAEQAIEYGITGRAIVDIIIDLLQSNDMAKQYFKGSATNSMLASIALQLIAAELEAEKELIEGLGFDLSTDSEMLSQELYDVACVYYDNGQNENSIKLSIIEMVRFVLEKIHKDKNAQANAEYYYTIYSSALANGEAAAIQAEIAKASSHTYGNWYTATEATCTADGQKRQDCSGCGAFNTETITSKGHSWDDWFTETEATCTDPGQARRNCDNCDAYETNVIPTAEHEYTKLNYNTTSHWYECTCGDKAEPQDHVDSDGNDECDVCDYTIDPIGSTGVYGDANGDGKVDTRDARLILQYYINDIGEADLYLSVSDVNSDGKVDTRDARLILRYYVEDITVFPIEEKS